MTDNIVTFKPKYTLEQQDINFLKEHLTILRNNEVLLYGYITRPHLGTEHWANMFETALLSACSAGIDWLINDLNDRDAVADKNSFNMYMQLIKWYKDAGEGERYSITMYTSEGETMQFVFLCALQCKLALVAIYDENKDITTGILKILNDNGMTHLGYIDE